MRWGPGTLLIPTGAQKWLPASLQCRVLSPTLFLLCCLGRWAEGSGAQLVGIGGGLWLHAAWTVQVEWRQGDQSLSTNLFDLWQPVTPEDSPASSLGTLPLQIGRFPGRAEWIHGAGTGYSIGEVSSWDQPCLVLTHKVRGAKPLMGALVAQLRPGPLGVCPNWSLLQPHSIAGGMEVEPDNRLSCKLFEGRDHVLSKLTLSVQ